jgi:polar amino acid transport system permease protein
MDHGPLFIDTYFNPELIARYLPDILKGMGVTIEIVAGIALGLALALIRSLRSRLINVPIVVFVDVARALPPLVLVLIVYFGLPNVGILLPSYAVLWLVLSILLAAFAEEISGPASCRCARASGRRRARPGSPTPRRCFTSSCPRQYGSRCRR